MGEFKESKDPVNSQVVQQIKTILYLIVVNSQVGECLVGLCHQR